MTRVAPSLMAGMVQRVTEDRQFDKCSFCLCLANEKKVTYSRVYS